MSSLLDFQSRLAEVQAANRRLRLAALVSYAPVVCGLPLRPLTLTTYNLLLAWGNPFVCGGPVNLPAIVQYIWLHQPEFGQFSHRARRRCARQIDRALTPRWPALGALARFFCPLLARARFPLSALRSPLSAFIRPTADELYSSAIADLRQIVADSLFDFPPAGDDAPAAPYALAPSIVSLFIRSYGLDFAAARALVYDLPLKELVEYLRETLHRLSAGKDSMLTAEEARIWADYMEYRDPPTSPAPTGPLAQVIPFAP